MTVRNRVQAGDGDPRHGRYTTYSAHGCRCDLCSAAGSARWATWNAEGGQRREIQPGDGDPAHGTRYGYNNLKCRCDVCAQAALTFERSRTARVIKPGDGDPAHGTRNGYLRLKCRCDACHDAQAAYRAAREGRPTPGRRSTRRRRLVDALLAEPVRKHGTLTAYNKGCRCEECRRCKAAYQRRRRAGTGEAAAQRQREDTERRWQGLDLPPGR